MCLFWRSSGRTYCISGLSSPFGDNRWYPDATHGVDLSVREATKGVLAGRFVYMYPNLLWDTSMVKYLHTLTLRLVLVLVPALGMKIAMGVSSMWKAEGLLSGGIHFSLFPQLVHPVLDGGWELRGGLYG